MKREDRLKGHSEEYIQGGAKKTTTRKNIHRITKNCSNDMKFGQYPD